MFSQTSKPALRVQALLLLIIMLFGTILISNPNVSLAAGPEPTIKIGSCQIAPGETGIAAITGQNIPGPGLAGYRISIQYDPLKLEVIGLEKSASDSFSMLIPNYDLPGTVTLTAVQTMGVKGDITLARLCFKAKALAVGSTNLSLTIKELVLADLKVLQAQAVNGQVDITSKSSQNPQLPNPLTISIVNLPTAVSNQAYSYTLQVNNGTPPYVWSASSLPDGLTINPQTGEISGLPTAKASPSIIEISVSDSQTPVQTVTTQMVLDVTESNIPTSGVGAPGQMIPPQPVKVYETARLSGYTATQTAVQIAKEAAKEIGWTGTAILASSNGMVDALTAGPLAAYLKAPILLTGTGALDADTKAALTELAVQTVYVTSGTAVISQAVLNELTDLNIKVVPLGGIDRFETSVNIAKQMVGFTKVAVANSLKDALSIASIAAAQNQPILLTEKDVIPACVETFLQANTTIETTDVIGGTSVISDSVMDQLPSATRHAGITAYDTNSEVIQDFDTFIKYDHVYLANGETAIDALAGAPLVAQSKAAIILTNQVVPEAVAFVKGKLTSTSVVTALGGTAAVPDTVLAGFASK